MHGPVEVFLDTNVFDSLFHSFHNGKLLHIKELVYEGKISIFLTDIVIGETKKHIKRNVSELRKALKKTLDKKLNEQGYESWNTGKQAFEVISALGDYSFIYNLLDKNLEDKMVRDALAQFDLYMSETHATIIDSKCVDSTAIVSDYFCGNPPFEESKDKKSEFPDAFSMAIIREPLINRV